MNIFYQYSWLKALHPVSGDQINEMNNIRALRKFAKVFYGVQQASHEADINIIRASLSAFNEAKNINKGKRLWMASPYMENIFREADMVFTFTDTWTRWLKTGVKFGLNPNGIKWENVVTFPQTLSKGFDFTGQPPAYKIIGVFGRSATTTYPSALLENKDYFKRRFGVYIKESYTNKKDKFIPHREMPQVIRSCGVVIVGQHGAEWDFCGNIKPIEPAALGVPVILERSLAREEDFGKDYPLFVERGTMQSSTIKARDHLAEKVAMAMDLKQRKVALPYLLRAAKGHRIEYTSTVLEELLKSVL